MKRKLQVFVSSTFQDLIEERQAAVSAILKAGHIPAGMELFTSGDKSQMQTIKKWIDESDVYMLVLGGRYGSLEPSSGVSYTELEYDYAIEQEKPLFAVVINEASLEAKVKEHGTDMMEKENPKQLKMFREKVLSNISSFFDDHKDIKLCVHESLSDFASNRELKGWVSADEVTSTQPLLDEIGRLSRENDELKEKLKNAEKKIGTSPKTTTSDTEFEELKELLQSIKVTVPGELTDDGKDFENSLFDLFVSNKDSFITGVTNQIDTSEAASFMYHNLCPKLQIHGLVLNEKVASVRWRRFSVTKRGNDFLAYLEKQKLRSKK
jgi:nucleoside 2-deoxyribosyltransferase